MPAFYFFCYSCKEEYGKILAKSAKTPCPKCGRPGKRRPRPMTSTTKEVLDNGLMVRRVERIQGATEIYKERAKNDPTKREVVVTAGRIVG